MTNATAATTITLGRCKSCKRTFDMFVRDAAGAIIRPNAPENMTPQHTETAEATACPSCGVTDAGSQGGIWWAMADIKVRLTATACDAICSTATGTDCRCSCGGLDHGSRA